MQMKFPALFPMRVTLSLLPVSIAHTHLLYLQYSRKTRQMVISCADEGPFRSSAHHLHTSAFFAVSGLRFQSTAELKRLTAVELH
jgi:hypothetical protein